MASTSDTDTLKGVQVFDCKTINYQDSIGDGSYGHVHIGVCSNNVEYAIKQNFIKKEIDFIGSIKEMDLLIKLRGHPYIIDIKGISIGHPFIEPIKKERRHNTGKSDKIYFLYNVAIEDMWNFIYKESHQMYEKKLAITQFLLGLEYMHNKGIVHRDLKLSNLLWTKPIPGKRIRHLQIADFGLSKPVCNQEPSTPRIVTRWYRAPEIVLSGQKYDNKSDVWSVGCIIFEIISDNCFMDIESGNKKVLIKEILRRIPKLPSKEILEKMDIDNVIGFSLNSRRKTLKEQLNLTDQKTEELKQCVEEDKIQENAYDELNDLLEHLFVFDPEERFSVTQALNHSFFDPFRDLIDIVRKEYPPISDPIPKIYIYPIKERKWGFNIAKWYYNNRNIIPWYKHQMIFLAINMYDRYLNHLFTTTKRPHFLTQLETILDQEVEYGKYHNKHTAELYFYVCMYLAYKYYHLMGPGISFKKIVLKGFNINSKIIKIAEDFELYLLQQVFDFNIYSPTLLTAADMIDIQLTSSQIRDLLKYYGENYQPDGINLDQYVKNFLEKN